MIRIMEPGKLALAVLASGRGSNFDAICDAIDRKELNAEIKIVISDKQAPVLKKATDRGLNALFINPSTYTNKSDYEQALVECLQEHQVDLVVLAGYMRLVGTVLLQAYNMRIVNIHPALLPSFTGLHAQRQAVAYGVKYSGCTVHFVDQGMDTGPIIAQAVVPVSPDDDEDSLAARILVQEHQTYWRALQLIAEGKVYVQDRKVFIKEEALMKRALISVSNKNGIVEFARGLEALGYEIISTGGTYKALQEAGCKVRQVSDITGFPEILDGRVKTLHPKVHGGILARRTPAHLSQLEQNAIDPIDIVVVNLYPFRETISKPGVSLAEAIENIDIGGPTMVRAAAKNYQDVLVIVKPEFYQQVLEQLQAGQVTEEMKFRLALEAFSHTAAYDAMISTYLAGIAGETFRDNMVVAGEKVYELRYGENPHQKACFYRNMSPGNGLPDAVQLNGKELSYNNIIDTQAAWGLVKEFAEPACVIIKHTNPCGTAVAGNLTEAYERAFAGDPVSAFGGIIAFNRTVDLKTAEKAAEPFMEVIIAPGYDEDALARLQAKKNLRVLELPVQVVDEMQIRTVEGGFVVQETDKGELDLNSLEYVTETRPSAEQLEQLAFAWKVVKHVKSNAIVIARDGMTVGVGAGQMNRVGSAEIAIKQAAEKCEGAVMASDAFFPFKDTVELAAQAGIKAIIQPGGSIRDQESIEECDKYGIAMIFTGVRHFRH